MFRLLEEPVSLLVTGASSAGKSYVTGKVIDLFFPSEACIKLTSASEKALIYSKEVYSHRFIWIFERQGMNNENFDYLVRTLMSEGCIKYSVTEKMQRVSIKPGI